MNEAQTALRATERARAGLTVPLSRIFAALTGAPGPARLARGDEIEKVFQRAIRYNPEDRTNRLVYADWLDEHGAADEAKWQRVEAALSTMRLEPYGAQYQGTVTSHDGDTHSIGGGHIWSEDDAARDGGERNTASAMALGVHMPNATYAGEYETTDEGSPDLEEFAIHHGIDPERSLHRVELGQRIRRAGKRAYAALNEATKLARKFQADTRPFVAALDAERPEWQRVGQPWMSSSSHDVLADKLDEDDDPRADIIRGRIHESGPGGNIDWMGALSDKARMNRGAGLSALMQEMAGQRTFRTVDANTRGVQHEDGGMTGVHRIRMPGGHVYHVRTRIPTRGNNHEYETAMDHEQFTKWRDSMEPEERAKFLFPDEQPSTAPPHPDTIDHNARELNKPQKNARANDLSGHQSFIDTARTSGDPIDLGVLGDYHEENGLPGAGLLRMAHEQRATHDTEGVPGNGSGWIAEDGRGSYNWNPHATEVFASLMPDGSMNFRTGITGHRGGDDNALKFNVRAHDPVGVRRALSDLPRAQAAALARFIARAWAHKPWRKATKLARAGDALTYVGGSVPGGQRAQGFWTGGTEKSTVVRVPSQFVDRAAVDIARRNHQKSALWFTPGKGSDVLHILQFNDGYPRSLSRILRKHGVSEFTITENPRSVHVVDKGGILGGAVKAAAAESGAQYAAHPGTAGYAELNTKLARKRDTDPRARAQELNAFLRAAHNGGYNHTDLHPFADWLREVTGNPDDPRAHVVQNHQPGDPRLPPNPTDGVSRFAFRAGFDRSPALYTTAQIKQPHGLYFDPVVGGMWGGDHHPATHAIITWRVPHPGSRNRGSDRQFKIVVDANGLHDFMDKLPEQGRWLWKGFAEEHRLHDTRGAKENPPPV